MSMVMSASLLGGLDLFDHKTGLSMRAGPDCPAAGAQRLSKLGFKVLQGIDLGPNSGQPTFDNLAHLRAGLSVLASEVHQFLYFRQRKAEILGLSDELQLINFNAGKHSISAGTAGRRFQQTCFLVEANGVYRQAGCFGGFTDSQRLSHDALFFCISV